MPVEEISVSCFCSTADKGDGPISSWMYDISGPYCGEDCIPTRLAGAVSSKARMEEPHPIGVVIALISARKIVALWPDEASRAAAANDD